MVSIPIQTTFGTTYAKGVPGQIANEEKYDAISRSVETAAGIGFGQPAFRGTQDHTVVGGGAFAATAAATANAGNTGNGTSSAVTAASPAMSGAYALRFDSATGYTVTAPDGTLVGRGTTGVAFNSGGLGFTITAGGTAFVAGDGFTIAVTYTANNGFVGIAVKTIAPEGVFSGDTLLTDGYSRGTTGSFMVEGQMYVLAGGAVTPGARVSWNPANGRYTVGTGILLPSGIRFDTTGANGDIVEISLGNRRV